MDWIAVYHRSLGLGNVLLLRRGTRLLLWTPGGIRLIVILAQRKTAELVSQGHLRWPPSVGQDWGAILGCCKKGGPAQNQVLLVHLIISPLQMHRTIPRFWSG